MLLEKDGIISNKIMIFLYFVMILTVYTSGSIYFTSFHYTSAVLLLLFVSVILRISIHNIDSSIKPSAVIFMIIFFLLISMTIIFNKATNYSSYLAILIQIFTAFLIASSFTFSNFKRIYVNVMAVLAAISLVCFAIVLINPTFMLKFNMTPGDGSLYYYNAIVHVFCSSKGFGHFRAFTRNNGIFWEPGAYQAFLNIALLFLLDKNSGDKRDIFKLASIILAIFTTFSTTGYIVMFVIIAFKFSGLLKIVRVKATQALGALIVLLIVVFLISRSSMNGFMSGKISSEFGAESTFLKRLYLDDLSISLESIKNFLFGISYEAYYERKLSSGNSLIQTMVCLGIPFVLTLISMYGAFCINLKSKRFISFIILIMIFSTESLLWRPLFLTLAWYGILGADSNPTEAMEEIYNESIDRKLRG